MAAPVIASQFSVNNDTATASAVFTKPSGTASGDLLIAFVLLGTPSAITPPGSWNTIGVHTDASSGSDGHIAAYWRVAGGSEPSNYTFSFSSIRNVGVMFRITGADTSNPINVSTVKDDGVFGSDAFPVCPSVTTTVADCLLLSAVSGDLGARTYTKPGGGSPIWQAANSALSETRASGAVADEAIGSSGATGTRTFTASGNTSYCLASIAIAPAAGGGGTEHVLLADDIASGTPTVGSPSLGQKHAFTANGVATAAPSVATPVFGQVHVLLANQVAAGSPSVGSPVLGAIHSLLANDVATGSPSVGSPVIGQKHSLAANAVSTGSPSATSPAIGQAYALNGADVAAGGPSVTIPAFGQVHALAGDGVATGTPGVGEPVVGQTHNLAADDVASGAATFSEPAIGQVYGLVGGDVSSGIPTVSVPSLASGFAANIARRISMAAKRQLSEPMAGRVVRRISLNGTLG